VLTINYFVAYNSKFEIIVLIFNHETEEEIYLKNYGEGSGIEEVISFNLSNEGALACSVTMFGAIA
jgi:hypothetical protein